MLNEVRQAAFVGLGVRLGWKRVACVEYSWIDFNSLSQWSYHVFYKYRFIISIDTTINFKNEDEKFMIIYQYNLKQQYIYLPYKEDDISKRKKTTCNP
jgi:hypothetical protein